MSRTGTGAGYHLVEANGATVSFGDAPSGFLGPVTPPSAGHGAREPRIVGIMPTPLSGGYWRCDTTGGVEPSGDAQLLGGMAGTALVRPVVGCEASLNLSG